jgi:hypothetical protein
MSDESSPTPEVFVRAFPAGGAKRRVSSGGGATPFWTKDGPKLIFTTTGNPFSIMAVDVTVQGETLQLGKPQKLFETRLVLPPNGVPYGVSADGNQFALLLPQQDAIPSDPTSITLVFNFFEEIRRTVGPRR